MNGLRLFLALYARQTTRRGRTLLSVLGVALGIALGYGVHLVNRAAVSDVAASVRALAGEADLEVRGGRSGFAEELYPRIARLPGVGVASPALELDAGIAGTERTLRITGIDILRAALLQPQLVLEDRYELLAPDRVFLSTAAAQMLAALMEYQCDDPPVAALKADLRIDRFREKTIGLVREYRRGILARKGDADCSSAACNRECDLRRQCIAAHVFVQRGGRKCEFAIHLRQGTGRVQQMKTDGID